MTVPGTMAAPAPAAAVEAAATAAAREAAALLALPRVPEVLWAAPDRMGFAWGLTNAMEAPNTVILATSVPLDLVRAVTFHECRHLWQWATSRYLGRDVESESDAEQFARTNTGHPGGLEAWRWRMQCRALGRTWS